MNLQEAKEQGYDDGYEGRRESELTAIRSIMDLVGLEDEADELLEAYAFEYGRGTARREHEREETGLHDFNDFMSDFLPFGDWSGFSETAHEGYHEERKQIEDEINENGEGGDGDNEIDDGTTDYGSGGSGDSSEPLSFRDLFAFCVYILFFTPFGWFILAAAAFTTLGYCVSNTAPQNATSSAVANAAIPQQPTLVQPSTSQYQISYFSETRQYRVNPLDVRQYIPMYDGPGQNYRIAGSQLTGNYVTATGEVVREDGTVWISIVHFNNDNKFMDQRDLVLSEVVDQAPAASAPDQQPTESTLDKEVAAPIIGFGNRETREIRYRLEREAYEYEREQRNLFMKEYQDALGGDPSCYRREELCQVAYREQRIKERQAFEDRVERVRQIKRMTDEEILSYDQAE